MRDAAWRDSADTLHKLEPSDAALLLIVIIALTLAIGYPAQSYSLIGGVLVTEWLLIAVPLLIFLRRRGLTARSVLLVQRPAVGAVAGAALAGVSAWYLVGILVEQLQGRFLPLPSEVQEGLRRLVNGRERPLGLDLFALAISPAICEECLFRGLLLRATERAWSPPVVIVVNAVLFAAFHLSIYRFLPTALLGLVLAVLAWRTRSIVPSITFHLLNNGVTLLVGRYGMLGGIEPRPDVRWVVVCGFAFSVGLGIALWRTPARPVPG